MLGLESARVKASGGARVLSLPEAMDPLIYYYKRFPDENPDWDDLGLRLGAAWPLSQRISLR